MLRRRNQSCSWKRAGTVRSPLRFNVAQRLGDVVSRVSPWNTSIGGASAPRSVEETSQLAGEAATDMVGRSADRSNLMSYEHRFAIVVDTVRVGENSRHLCFFGEALTHIHLIDHHTAEAERRAIMETISTYLDCDLFSVKARAVATHSASSSMNVEVRFYEKPEFSNDRLHVSSFNNCSHKQFATSLVVCGVPEVGCWQGSSTIKAQA